MVHLPLHQLRWSKPKSRPKKTMALLRAAHGTVQGAKLAVIVDAKVDVKGAEAVAVVVAVAVVNARRTVWKTYRAPSAQRGVPHSARSVAKGLNAAKGQSAANATSARAHVANAVTRLDMRAWTARRPWPRAWQPTLWPAPCQYPQCLSHANPVRVVARPATTPSAVTPSAVVNVGHAATVTAVIVDPATISKLSQVQCAMKTAPRHPQRRAKNSMATHKVVNSNVNAAPATVMAVNVARVANATTVVTRVTVASTVKPLKHSSHWKVLPDWHHKLWLQRHRVPSLLRLRLNCPTRLLWPARSKQVGR